MGASKQLGKMMSSNSEGNKLQGSGRFAGSPIRFPSYAIGSRGKASFKSNPFVGDSFDKEDQKEKESTKNDFKPTKVNKDTDYDDTKKRLLELAKAEGLDGAITRLNGAISSQYLTSILLVSPYAKNEVQIEILDKLVFFNTLIVFEINSSLSSFEDLRSPEFSIWNAFSNVSLFAKTRYPTFLARLDRLYLLYRTKISQMKKIIIVEANITNVPIRTFVDK